MTKNLRHPIDTVIAVLNFAICIVVWTLALPIELVLVFTIIAFGRFRKTSRTNALNELRDYFFMVNDAFNDFRADVKGGKAKEPGDAS